MSNEVAVKESALPALTEEEKAMGTGQDDVTIDDLILPKLQISAAKSKYMKEGNEAYVEGLREGHIFNTLTEQIHGKEVFIVPIKKVGRNRVMFTPSFGVECKSDNGIDGGHISPDSCEACEFSKWGSAQKGNGSACTLFENMVVDVVNGDGRPQMVLVSFKKKAIETYKKFQTLIGMRTEPETNLDLPQYRGKYRLGVGTAQGESGPYDLWSIKNAGFVDGKDYEKVKGHYLKLKKQGVVLGDNE